MSKRGTLAVACFATAILMLDIAVVNTALGHIADDLHAGLSGLQWVVDAYTLALASVVLTAGSVADRLGRKRVFVAGVSLFTVASAACAAAGSIAALDAARAVQGLGGAIMFATSLALLADAYPGAEERTKALAAYGATIGGAFVIGPLAGGALTTGFGWQAVFLVNVPLGVITLVATARWVRESSDRDARRLDWPGQATLSAALFLLVLGLLRGNDQGWTSAPIVAEFAASALLFAAFIAIERRVAAPMLPLSLFRKGTIIGGGLALVSAGLVLGLLAKADSPWTVPLPTLVIGGIGSGVFNPALSMVALSSAPQRMSGLAAGVNDTFRQAGIAVGVAAFGALVPANSALGGGSPTEYVAGMHNALIAGAILAGVGAVASVVLIGASRHGTAAEPALEAS